MSPQGYGLKVGGDDSWGLNYMLHSLNADSGRQVYVTWEIDWVPETDPPRTDIQTTRVQWMDVAGLPHVYPVFDAERGFDLNGDGKYVFPDEVPTDPNAPGYEERENISPLRKWTVPDGGRTLVFGAGHLHPGGEHVDLQVARDGPDPGEVDGDDPGEIRPLFRSDAQYYEPAGAVSWDVSMEATRPDWRISLKEGDTVSINVTYDVKQGVVVRVDGDPAALDQPLRRPGRQGPVRGRGRGEGDVRRRAASSPTAACPRTSTRRRARTSRSPTRASCAARAARSGRTGIEINGFGYSLGGFSAFKGFPTNLMRPPKIQPGQSVTFTNFDALPEMTDNEQAWHTVTSCSAPCNQGSGIGYPLAKGKIKFDSGQLGYGTSTSTEVTTGSNVYTTPPLTKPGKTYTYFCRIHPFMRGSVRVAGKAPKGPKNLLKN